MKSYFKKEMALLLTLLALTAGCGREAPPAEEGKIPVAAIHPASAGHGLNIQDGGHILIWFGLTWSLELYMQCNARLWRQGQKAKTVVIKHILTEGTIDRQIYEALLNKHVTQSALMNAVRAQI